jgi:SanA protein
VKRKIWWLLLAAAAAPVVFAVWANCWILYRTDDLMYSDPALLPPNDVGLLLGTSKYLPGGGESRDFRKRIEAAALLFRTGRIRHILASGTGLDDDYDETAVMKAELEERGVPASAITLDPAGLRTLDSVIRANRVFGLDRFTIISQEYHNPRALYIGMHHGLDVVGFCAEDDPPEEPRRTTMREFFARIKAALDLYLLGTEPAVLEERREINVSPSSTPSPPVEKQRPM